MILRKHGLEGYAFCWICREIVAKEGEKQRLKAEKDWKITLKEVTKLAEEKIDELLKYQAEIGAIDHKALEIGDLYIPKIKEYSDDYTKQLRRKFVETSLRIDKIRIDKIILHYIKVKGWESGIKETPSMLTDIFKRNVRPAKQLIVAANNDEVVMRVISEMSKDYNKKGLSWTLETVLKHLPEFTKNKETIDNFIKEE